MSRRIWRSMLFCLRCGSGDLCAGSRLLPSLVSYLFFRFRAFTSVLLNVLFQCGLCLFVGNTFTLFFYGMNVASFAFLTWPSSPMKVTYAPTHRLAAAFQRFLEWVDLDRRVIWTPLPITGAIPLELAMEGKSYSGFRALRMIVLFNPITYLVFTAAMAASGNGESLDLAIYRRVLVGMALVLLMPPLAWIADRMSGGRLASAGAPHPDHWRAGPLG